MPTRSENIYHVFDRMLPRSVREASLRQRSQVFWLFGLSGSGKSTLALALERALFERGHFAQVLDGDNIRTGLNRDLGFSDADRAENIRRIAEVAKLFAQAGVITITSFICPKEELRQLAKGVIGAEDFSDIYVKASYERCQERDPKGLYQKVRAGQVTQFTGKDSLFEEPSNPALVIDTENHTIAESSQALLDFVLPRVSPN